VSAKEKSPFHMTTPPVATTAIAPRYWCCNYPRVLWDCCSSQRKI